MLKVELHSRARTEAGAAWRWYAKASQVVASRFASAFADSIDAIQSNPAGQAPYIATTRIARVKGFPYLLVFVVLASDLLQVVAVAHTSRRPGYWRRRLT